MLFLLYFLLGRVVPWSLAVTMTLLLGRKHSVWLSLLLVGLMGLIEDVAGIRPLGVSSAFFIFLWGLVWFVHRQYRGQWMWWYGLGVAGEIGFRLITGAPITWASLVGQVVALWLVFWLVRRVGQTEGIYVEK